MSQFALNLLFQQATQHHQAGRLREAEPLYRQILAQQPQNPDALHLLGVIASQTGNNETALTLIRQSLTLNPRNPQAHNNLGNVLKSLNRFDEALLAYRHALALNPNFPTALNNLGTILKDQGHLPEALAALHQAIALNPNYAEAHINLALALKAAGQLDQALAASRRAIALNPNNPSAYNNLANILNDQGHPEEAVAAYRQSLTLRPHDPLVLSNLANALLNANRPDEAAAACRQAIALQPDYPEAHFNLGNALLTNYQIDEAVAAFTQAVTIKPTYYQAHSNLGNALKERGQVSEALAAYQQALTLEPGHASTLANIIFALYYHDGDGARIFQKSREWNTRHALRHLPPPHANSPDPDRPLNIAYVSPDFRHHSVAFFFTPLLENHDRSRFHITCYANNLYTDPTTARLQKAADAWRSITRLTDDQAAELIRQDRIDILIDLAGHSSGGRPLLFARKPAPFQLAWLGFPGTTGLDAIDYRISDPLADPPGLTDQFSSEKILRLPRSAWCFSPLSGSPPISPPPVLKNNFITFGSFSNLAKISPQTLNLWAQILLRVPHSRLLIKNAITDSPHAISQLQQFFAARNLSPARLELVPRQASPLDHLQLYNRLDIALDTFPYHGTTTTCESLWMGVPTITLAGQTHASRVGVSLLSNLGLPELIAPSEEQYISLAATLAADLPKLTALRSTLRPQMQSSPLMNAPQFTAALESAYRQIWQQWCTAKRP